MSPLNREEVLAKAEAIAERVKTDPQFAEQLNRDPQATLLAEGLPAAIIPAFLSHRNLTEIPNLGWIE